MTDRQIFLPEALYASSPISSEVELFSSVSGTAIRFDSYYREIIVSFGNGLFGIIPEEEATIYDFTFPGESIIPHQISSIIGKKIRAIVTGRRKNGMLLLSRRRSMLQAWETLHTDTIVNALITKVLPYGIFVDLGNGLNSFVRIIDCTHGRYRNLNIWLKPGDCTLVKITSKSDENYFITVSRKEAFPTLEDNPSAVFIGDIISVKISGKIDGMEDGYFCEYTPGITGIIDSSNTYDEGEIVKGYVKRITPKGLKLALTE